MLSVRAFWGKTNYSMSSSSLLSSGEGNWCVPKRLDLPQSLVPLPGRSRVRGCVVDRQQFPGVERSLPSPEVGLRLGDSGGAGRTAGQAWGAKALGSGWQGPGAAPRNMAVTLPNLMKKVRAVPSPEGWKRDSCKNTHTQSRQTVQPLPGRFKSPLHA